jgi:signal transduction histidine kinase/HPt (histidine-containing phosphotransfer) domain-containing protein/ActR/RegA family two-component response regulator
MRKRPLRLMSSDETKPVFKFAATNGGITPGRPHPSSLLWRFLLIGVAALAPLVGALVQLAGNERDVALRAARERAEFLAASVVEGQNHTIEKARSALGFLAIAPEVRAGGTECDAFLARYRTLHQWIDMLRLSSPDGGVICGDRSETKAVDVNEQEYFKTALNHKKFALTEPTINPTTRSLSTTAAMPVIESGRVSGVLSIGVEQGALGRMIPHQSGSPDINMLVVDRKGVLVSQYPQNPNPIGVSVRGRPIVEQALALRAGHVVAPDLSGVERLFVFRTLPETEAVIVLGLDPASFISVVDQALRHRMILIAMIITGSVLLAVLGAEILIFRPLRNLAATAEALEQGDFGARSPYEGTGEVGLLARALNSMAEAVADRERELKSARDVAEEALRGARLANRAKTDFLASMSHEIRTPLHGIIGYTERLLDEQLSPQQARYAELIQVAGSALLTVANDILDLSSIEADQVRLQHEPFSLRPLVYNTVSIVSSGAGKKGVPIKVVMDPDVPDLLMGDEARLRQILLNLLNNAVKFTREGHITTRVAYKGSSPAGELMRISVIDTGIGIAPEKRDCLFKRFSQVDASIRREFGGTGLGLAISKRLIELMGGQIGVESAEGQGSVFWIEVALPRGQVLPHDIRDAPAATAVAPARILIAEDVPVNQELAQALLETAGHEVDVVSNGEEAIAAVKAKPYDLVLMDIQMPGMDGITATRWIRALPPPAGKTLIIAMTANVLLDQVRSFRAAGMDDHIGKPLRREDLLRKLNEWLAPTDTPCHDSAADRPGESGFDEKAYQDLIDTIGVDRVSQWLVRLDEQLQCTLASGEFAAESRQQIASTAHAMVSQAALLGFSDLAALCSRLEQACHEGEDLGSLLRQTRLAAYVARQRIVPLLQNASDDQPLSPDPADGTSRV